MLALLTNPCWIYRRGIVAGSHSLHPAIVDSAAAVDCSQPQSARPATSPRQATINTKRKKQKEEEEKKKKNKEKNKGRMITRGFISYHELRIFLIFFNFFSQFVRFPSCVRRNTLFSHRSPFFFLVCCRTPEDTLCSDVSIEHSSILPGPRGPPEVVIVASQSPADSSTSATSKYSPRDLREMAFLVWP